MTTFTFNDRDSFLAYRADWKARYKAQSEMIRSLKRDIRQAYAEGNQDRASSLQGTLAYQRSKANTMMHELMAAKEFKNQQLAARTAVAA